MATYKVLVFCNDCVDVHEMGVRLFLDAGHADKQSIGDVYNGKELPPEVYACTIIPFSVPRLENTFIRETMIKCF